ncbi:Sensor histidine kinase ResE [subsurface metagenome]
MVGEKEVGILCLSQKVSRQDFSSDDVYLLQGLASVAATSLYSAMLIRDVSMRDTFISVASHELRTPLTSILGYADLLLHRDPPSATRKRWLKNIFDNSQRVNAMVDDLLNVSRIQSGKVGMKLERVRLSNVLEETLSLAKESTNKHEFVVDIEPYLPDVFVDRDKLSHVVGNILSNAVKYSPNGGRITLSAHNDQGRYRIVVSVADEGIGISPADKDLLFTTFHRIQRPETKGIRGSGLGLYIVKEWIEAMGGKIWLESELNKGSTFFVAIPTQNSSGTG